MIRGTLVRCKVTFLDAANAKADPTTATLIVRKPSGAMLTYAYPADPEVVREGTGDFYADVLADQAGAWGWRWEGAGAVVAVDEGVWHVEESRVL